MRVRWTEQAHARLVEIFEFVARDDIDAAERLMTRLVDRGASLARLPRSGRRVPEIRAEDVREVIERNYRIVYRIRPGSIEILTVFEGHRLLRRDEVKE